MAVSIADISIKLGATSDALRRDLKDGESALDSYHKKAASSSKEGGAGGGGGKESAIGKASELVKTLEESVKKGIEKLALFAGAAEVTKITIASLHESMEVMGKSGKLAEQLGTTTERLQRLRWAGMQFGEGAGSIDSALGGLKKTFADIAKGEGKEAEATLTQLGFSIKKLTEADPTQAFRSIAEAIKKIASPTARAQVAMDIFGESSKSLWGVLGQGASGLDRLGKESDALGRSFSKMDSARVEEANRAVGRLEAAFGGMVQVLAVKLTPVMIVAADVLTKVYMTVLHADQIFGENITRLLSWGLAIRVSMAALSAIIPVIKAVTSVIRLKTLAQIAALAFEGPSGWAKLAAGAAIASVAIYGVTAAYSSVTEKIEAAEKKTAKFVDAAKELKKVEIPNKFGKITIEDKGDGNFVPHFSGIVKKDMAAAERIAQQAIEKMQADFFKPTAEEWEAHDRRSAKIVARMEEINRVGARLKEEVATPAEKYKTTLELIVEELKEGAISMETFDRQTMKAAKDLKEAEEALKKINEVGKVAVGAAVRGTSAGSSAVFEGRNALIKMQTDTKEQIALQKELNEINKKIEENTRKDGIVIKSVRI